MICYLANESNTPLINLVRREEHVKMLKEEYGQKYVLCTKSDTFFADLKALAEELGAKVFIDCVSGEMTGKTIENLPVGSTTYYYGALSGKPISDIDPFKFKGRAQKICGFVLSAYLRSKGAGALAVLKKSGELMKQGPF